MMLQAILPGIHAGSPLTPRSGEISKHDNVVAEGAETFAGSRHRAGFVEAILPHYLWRFRREGQYDKLPDEKLIAASKPR